MLWELYDLLYQIVRESICHELAHLVLSILDDQLRPLFDVSLERSAAFLRGHDLLECHWSTSFSLVLLKELLHLGL